MMTFQSKPSLIWKTGQASVRIFDTDDRRTFLLKGFEAALWNWLTSGYSFSKIKVSAAEHLKTDQAIAAAVVFETLQALHEQGILIKVSSDSNKFSGG